MIEISETDQRTIAMLQILIANIEAGNVKTLDRQSFQVNDTTVELVMVLSGTPSDELGFEKKAHYKAMSDGLGDWRPIETAPREQTIIGYWPQLIPHHPDPGVIGVCKKHEWYWVVELFGQKHECAPPTHWMPLPPPHGKAAS